MPRAGGLSAQQPGLKMRTHHEIGGMRGRARLDGGVKRFDEFALRAHRREARHRIGIDAGIDDRLNEPAQRLHALGYDLARKRMAQKVQTLAGDRHEIGRQIDQRAPVLGVGEFGSAIGATDEDDATDRQSRRAPVQKSFGEHPRDKAAARIRDDVEGAAGGRNEIAQRAGDLLGVARGIVRQRRVIEAEARLVALSRAVKKRRPDIRRPEGGQAAHRRRECAVDHQKQPRAAFYRPNGLHRRARRLPVRRVR